MEKITNLNTTGPNGLSRDEIAAQVEKRVLEEEKIYGAGVARIARVKGVTSEDILSALDKNEDGDAWLFIQLHRNQYCHDRSMGLWY